MIFIKVRIAITLEEKADCTDQEGGQEGASKVLVIVSCCSWLFHRLLLYGNSLNCTFEVIQ